MMLRKDPLHLGAKTLRSFLERAALQGPDVGDPNGERRAPLGRIDTLQNLGEQPIEACEA
ncbi:hypothetical protein [Variovorax sp. Sphag1AA]|uniref:hypothetical protein n=1 Tax=Variovorax sp. Sphag1AA TaxID=2587027 RepID=UPI001611CAD3|nr:hypothetical protein [Variovorax sp. Sphag1AA]